MFLGEEVRICLINKLAPNFKFETMIQLHFHILSSANVGY